MLATVAREIAENSDKALAILGSDGKEFASSQLIKLEVLPKAIYHQQSNEVEFYEEFFQAVTYWANDFSFVVTTGYNLACKYGLAAIDALHIGQSPWTAAIAQVRNLR